jgi:hypothetical protein
MSATLLTSRQKAALVNHIASIARYEARKLLNSKALYTDDTLNVGVHVSASLAALALVEEIGSIPFEVRSYA